MSSIIFQVQSIIVVGLLLFGLYHKRNKFKHVKIMKLAIIWDLLLVAQIELNRGAILKASNAVSNSMILNIHVFLAVSTVLLYIPTFYLGNKLDKGKTDKRKMHKICAFAALTCRILTLITSYLVVD